ncbi:hypothetical protein E1A91_A08G280600v1 [Gossypium mustelinum]|uniref:Uncharacterized protein n=1 Tax=Gossypium mustelinum TaxID=34275 RepID=A0A5D2YI07_GOSMU|nr:hypothetical protein E1A91_A08G280600v1 [Gossypium mustelinum]
MATFNTQGAEGRSEQIFGQPPATRKQMDPRCYFKVNDQYVMNKLKLILFPFLHQPPIDDVNAPDLYIPLMAFGTYVVLAGFFLGISGKQLQMNSEPVFVECHFLLHDPSVQATNGMLGWLFQVLLEATLHTFGDGDVPLLDIVAYGGYTFVAVSITIVWRTIWSYSLYVVAVSFKRILIAEVRRSEKHSSKRHYLLLRLAVALLGCNILL